MSRPDEAEVRYALGGGLMLLAGIACAGVGALLLRGTAANTYITFLMPALIGWLAGSALGLIGRRFAVGRRDAALIVSVVVLVGYAGYHVVHYLDVLDFVAANTTTLVERAAAPDPALEALARIEAVTGREGFMAYLAYTGAPAGETLSPFGLIAGAHPGAWGGVALLAGESVIAVAVGIAGLFARLRRRSTTPGPAE